MKVFEDIEKDIEFEPKKRLGHRNHSGKTPLRKRNVNRMNANNLRRSLKKKKTVSAVATSREALKEASTASSDTTTTNTTTTAESHPIKQAASMSTKTKSTNKQDTGLSQFRQELRHPASPSEKQPPATAVTLTSTRLDHASLEPSSPQSNPISNSDGENEAENGAHQKFLPVTACALSHELEQNPEESLLELSPVPTKTQPKSKREPLQPTRLSGNAQRVQSIGARLDESKQRLGRSSAGVLQVKDAPRSSSGQIKAPAAKKLQAPTLSASKASPVGSNLVSKGPASVKHAALVRHIQSETKPSVDLGPELYQTTTTPAAKVRVDLSSAFSVAQRSSTKKAVTNDRASEESSPLGSVVAATPSDWAEKQCAAFTEWMNFTFDPTEDSHDASTTDTKNGFRVLIQQQRMGAVRMKSNELKKSVEMQEISEKIRTEIGRGRLCIREDRDLHADVPLRNQMLKLLFSYSTPWLRLGLETLFGETIEPNDARYDSPSKLSDGAKLPVGPPTNRLNQALRHFIVNRVLSDKTVLSKYTRRLCKVPSGRFGEKYQQEIRTVVLFRILVLVFFLDRAKIACLLDKVPRLFCKDAEVKSTKDLLLAFCRLALAQEGDFVKHLSRMGLRVSYRQEPIDEIDFRVSNLAIDLKDGILLARLAEILTDTPDLLAKLRLPTVSRLQKLHNVELVLDVLKKRGVPVHKDILPYQIVDSHRDVVLGLLWSMISTCCLHRLVDVERVKEEILQVKLSRGEVYLNPWKTGNSQEEETRDLLLMWCDAVCSHYGVSVRTEKDFADGVVFCLLLNYYMPNLLRLSEIRRTSRTTQFMHASKRDHAGTLENERRNCEVANNKVYLLGGIGRMIPISDSSSVPDSKCLLIAQAYLFARIMDCSQELKACITIQAFLRNRLKAVQLEKKILAASIILNVWREHRLNYFDAQRRYYGEAVARIENFLCGRLHRLQELRQRRLAWEEITRQIVSIQSLVRGIIARTKVRTMVHRQRVCSQIQCWWRRSIATNLLMALRVQRNAARKIQRAYRGSKANHHAKNDAAVLIQSQWRGFWTLLQYKIDVFDVIAAQSCARRYLALKDFWWQLSAIVRIQACARRFLAQMELSLLQHTFLMNTSATTIQAAFRKNKCENNFRLTKLASIRIQARWRQARARSIYANVLVATTIIQTRIRGYLKFSSFQRAQSASIKVQAFVRRLIARSSFEADTRKIILCQAGARAFLARQHANERQAAVAVVQSMFQMKIARDHFFDVKCATIFLQAQLRGWCALLKFRRELQRVVLIQSKARSFVAHLKFRRAQISSLAIQKYARGWGAKRQLMKLRQERALLEHSKATMIQSAYRGHLIRQVWSSASQAAIPVQACARRFLARRDFQFDMLQICRAQSIARRWIAVRAADQRYGSALKLQSIARVLIAKRAMLLKRCDYHRRTLAARKIQRQIRYLLRRIHAAMKIQSLWKCYLVHVDFCLAVFSARKIQAVVRMRAAAFEARRRLRAAHVVQGFCRLALDKAKAATKIQKHMRGCLERLRREDETVAATIIQSNFRGYIVHNYHLNTVVLALYIQKLVRGRVAKCFVDRLRTERKQIVMIQSLARARAVRSRMPKELQAVSKRVRKANVRAKRDPSQTLGARMAWALAEIFREPSMGKLTRAVMALETGTRLCKKSCGDLAHGDAVDTLVRFAQGCNRSLPHLELIHFILLTLVNVARHKEYAHAVATMAAGGLYIDLLQTFRDKEEIFRSAVFLLNQALDHSVVLVRHLRGSNENLKRLKQIKEIKSKNLGVKMAAPSKHRTHRTKTPTNNSTRRKHSGCEQSDSSTKYLNEIIQKLQPRSSSTY